MLQAALSLGAAGLLIGALLAVAAQKFKVETDEKVADILAVLPGANCGGCGYPGCAALAEAIARGDAKVNACTVGGAPCAQKIAEIMGVEEEAVSEPVVAVVYCQGGNDKAVISAQYDGIEDCAALNALGGVKDCPFGCLGLGSCVKACLFDAIHMGEDGLPVVDKDKCTGCGACVMACPRDIIDLVPKTKEVHILCRSYDKGPAVRKYCKVGCIACTICVKACPQKAISMDKGTLAVIDYALCDNCGICATKCPTKSIVDLQNFLGVKAS